MGASRRLTGNEIEEADIDWWAVNLVVDEGVRMNLGYWEKLAAVRGMKRKGMTELQMCDRLRVSLQEMEALERQVYRIAEAKRKRGRVEQPVS